MGKDDTSRRAFALLWIQLISIQVYPRQSFWLGDFIKLTFASWMNNYYSTTKSAYLVTWFDGSYYLIVAVGGQ